MSLGYVQIHDDNARLEIERVSFHDERAWLHCRGFFAYRRSQSVMGRITVYGHDDSVILSAFAFADAGVVLDGELTLVLPIKTNEVIQHEELDWRR